MRMFKNIVGYVLLFVTFPIVLSGFIIGCCIRSFEYGIREVEKFSEWLR